MAVLGLGPIGCGLPKLVIANLPKQNSSFRPTLVCGLPKVCVAFDWLAQIKFLEPPPERAPTNWLEVDDEDRRLFGV